MKVTGTDLVIKKVSGQDYYGVYDKTGQPIRTSKSRTFLLHWTHLQIRNMKQKVVELNAAPAPDQEADMEFDRLLITLENRMESSDFVAFCDNLISQTSRAWDSRWI